MGQASLLTQAPPSTLWVNNCVDQNTHMLCPATECELCYRKKNVALQHNNHVTLYRDGNAALSKSGPFNPVRAALCESRAGVSGSGHSLDTGQDFPFGLLAVLTSLLLSCTQSSLSKSQPLHRAVENLNLWIESNQLPFEISRDCRLQRKNYQFWCNFCSNVLKMQNWGPFLNSETNRNRIYRPDDNNRFWMKTSVDFIEYCICFEVDFRVDTFTRRLLSRHDRCAVFVSSDECCSRGCFEMSCWHFSPTCTLDADY